MSGVGTPLRDDVVHLPDGRRLAYAEWGDGGGTPILFFHAVPGSRLWFEEPTTAGRGVKLVTVDRPGYGRSDSKEGASLLSWADDVEQLVDTLGIDRFAVVAWSMGGPYALAAAARLPGRVTRLGLASISHVPPDEQRESMRPPSEADVRAAASDPTELVERWSASEEWRVYVERPEATTVFTGLSAASPSAVSLP